MRSPARSRSTSTIVIAAMAGCDPEGGASSRYGAENRHPRRDQPQDRRDCSLQRLLEVVETVEDDGHPDRSSPDAQRAQSRRAKIGDFIAEPLPPIDFGRIAAQSAKQVIVQKVRDAERDRSMTSTRTASARSSTAPSSASNTATSSSISAVARPSSAATS